MKCIHCEKGNRLPGGGVYCRLCALAFQKDRDKLLALPWWKWPAYGAIEWTNYLTALVAELNEPESPLALRSRPARASSFPPAAIRILTEDILGSS